MKNIEIIPLALKKINQRNISQQWIEKAINSPDQVVEGYSGRKVIQKKYYIDGKEMLLRIVLEEKKTKFVVITAYLTSQVDRYWR